MTADQGPTPRPVQVRALMLDVGLGAGHRLVLLSLEAWEDWGDLRFARIATAGATPLARRIPLVTDWHVTIDGVDAEVLDVTGRGDRALSTGEVRLRPCPPAGSTVTLHTTLAPGAGLSATFLVPG
jgi:hypothetical protein